VGMLAAMSAYQKIPVIKTNSICIALTSSHCLCFCNESQECPSSLTPRRKNSLASCAIRPSSVVQTGVKSAGWENKTHHLQQEAFIVNVRNGPGWVPRILFKVGWGSVVGIATTLRAGRSGDRIPVEARFSASVQRGPRAHPASRTMGTGSFPRVKQPGRGASHHAPF
jgi:hypothetical protein